jgi:hypothetical protein
MRDPFYRRGSEWDHYRFPLIKPYYAICLRHGDDWQIPIPGDVSEQDLDYYFAIQNVEQIAVENKLIMAYTSSHPGVFDANPELSDLIRNWFLLIPEEEIAIGFATENDFLDYLEKYDISNPEWLNLDELSVQFDNTKCLEWIPDCE